MRIWRAIIYHRPSATRGTSVHRWANSGCALPAQVILISTLGIRAASNSRLVFKAKSVRFSLWFVHSETLPVLVSGCFSSPDTAVRTVYSGLCIGRYGRGNAGRLSWFYPHQAHGGIAQVLQHPLLWGGKNSRRPTSWAMRFAMSCRCPEVWSMICSTFPGWEGARHRLSTGVFLPAPHPVARDGSGIGRGTGISIPDILTAVERCRARRSLVLPVTVRRAKERILIESIRPVRLRSESTSSRWRRVRALSMYPLSTNALPKRK